MSNNSNLTPKVNLGQSQFQDTYFVAGAEDAPYRKLRKIELQIRELKNALKSTDFSIRKNRVKLEQLDVLDPLQAIEKEEILWGLEQNKEMVEDAIDRLINFEKMKEQLIANTPQEYWDAGFEAAELDHWSQYYSKKLALEQMHHGVPSLQTVEQVMLLPQDIAMNIFKLRDKNVQALIGIKPD